ncbi:MAG: glycosyltransferase, partial [Desulfococcaceae bacterium]
MKIALVCKQFKENKGGLERYTIALSRELLKRGHQVHVLAHRRQEEPGIRFHHVPMLRFSSPLKNLSFAYFSRKVLEGHRFDVVQSMERVMDQDIFRASDGINP